MFVVQDLNVSEAAPDVGRVCSVAGCDPDSLLNQVGLVLGRAAATEAVPQPESCACLFVVLAAACCVVAV